MVFTVYPKLVNNSIEMLFNLKTKNYCSTIYYCSFLYINSNEKTIKKKKDDYHKVLFRFNVSGDLFEVLKSERKHYVGTETK